MKEQIYKICTHLNDGQIAVTEATEQLFDLFVVNSGSLPSVDRLDRLDEIGREIAEMSNEEFEANCKALEKMLKGSKGNDR